MSDELLGLRLDMSNSDPWNGISNLMELDDFLIESDAVMFRNFIFRDGELNELTLKFTFILPFTDEAFVKLSKSLNHCYDSIKAVVKNHLSVGPVNFDKYPVYVSLSGHSYGNGRKDFDWLGVHRTALYRPGRPFIMVVKTTITANVYPDDTNWLARIPHDLFVNIMLKYGVRGKDLVSLSHACRDLYRRCGHPDPKRNIFTILLRLEYDMIDMSAPKYSYINWMSSGIWICGNMKFDRNTLNPKLHTAAPRKFISTKGKFKYINRRHGNLALLSISNEINMFSGVGVYHENVFKVNRLDAGKNELFVVDGYCTVATHIKNQYRYYSNGECSFSIGRNNKVFAFGVNTNGRMGTGRVDNAGNAVDTPYMTPDPVLPNLCIQSMSCGYYHTGFIDFEGHVYMTGRSKSGRLGLGDPHHLDREIHIPIQIPNLVGIKSISCGDGHAGLLDSEGRPIMFGANLKGELGLQDIGNMHSCYIPMAIPGFVNMKQISCGSLHTALLDDRGRIWMCGDKNLCGVISVTDIRKPRLLQNFDGVKYVECSLSYTAFIDRHNNVWVFGDRVRTLSAVHSMVTSVTPTKIEGIKNVKQICCTPTNITFLAMPNPF